MVMSQKETNKFTKVFDTEMGWNGVYLGFQGFSV